MEAKYQSVFTNLVGTIRAASGLAANDVGFYRKLDKTLDKSVDANSAELLSIATDIMQAVVPGDVSELTENVTDHWNDISHTLDTMVEKIEIALDQYKKQGNQLQGPTVGQDDNKPIKLQDRHNNGKDTDDDTGKSVVKHHQNLAKPQLKFERSIDNSSNKPFKPLLTSKPFALQPLEDVLTIIHPNAKEDDEEGPVLPYYPQPYEREIMEQKYPKSIWKQVEPIPSKPWSSTEPIYVDTQDKLDEMVKALNLAKEIAIDLEHHDFRSFYGFVCLMQISDRENDYIVDTLALRDELQVLNTVFANPNIVKVLHGSAMDIIWLQRDFGLYIVSLFDTYHAARSLGLKRHGLAYLLETYSNFQTSKKYQLADWRIRPIPKEMMSYAQSDTHFLLNIYDQIKNELIERSGDAKKSEKLEYVIQESRITACQRYEIPGYDLSLKKSQTNPFLSSGGWKAIAYKYSLTPKQQIVLKALFDWRDQVARKEDESVRYIMPNHLMTALSTDMPLDVQGVLELASSSGPRIRVHVKDIVEVIKAAKVKVDKYVDADEDEDEVEASPAHNLNLLDTEELETNFDAYLSEFQKAKTRQTQSFTRNVTDLQQGKSHFLGKAVKDTGVLFIERVEHIDGISLLEDESKLAEFLGVTSESAALATAPVPVAVASQPVPENDKNLVYMGQSSVTNKLADPVDDEEEDDDDENENDDSDDKVASRPDAATLKSVFGDNQAPKMKKSVSARRRAKKQRGANSLAAEVGKKRALDSPDSTNDGLAIKKAKTEESGGIPVVAFDYSSAPSVLASADGQKNKKNNKRNNNKKNNNNNNNEPFNPYGNTDSAVKNVRKKKNFGGNSQNSGRSVTFRANKRK
jgi:exosome complex exonuclease RRP6